MNKRVFRPGQSLKRFQPRKFHKSSVYSSRGPFVQPMHSTVLSRTARRLATASPSAHFNRTFSATPGSIPPKKAAAKRASAPTRVSDDDTHAPTRPPAPSKNTPVDTPNPSELDPLAPPTPTTLSLDFAPPESGAERERTGAKSSKDSLSSIERRRKQLGRVSFGLFALGLLSGGIYLGREWTEDEVVSRRSVRVPFTWCSRRSLF